MKKQAQEKRQQFRQQIRRRHINEMFQKVRREHHERRKQEYPNIDKFKKQEIWDVVKNFIRKAIINYHNKDYKAILKDVKEVEESIRIQPRIVSMCLDQYLKKKGANFIDLMKKDISKSALDQLSIEVEENLVNSNKIQEEFDYQINITIICELMKLSSHVQYEKFSLQSAILILKPLWNIFEGNYHMVNQQYPKEAEQNLSILNNICISLSKLLQSPHHQTMKQQLRQMKLHEKLFEIIDLSNGFNLETHKNILQLVYYFNTILSEKIAEEQHILNGITIISSQDRFKSKYTLYCIYFLNKRIQALYELAMNTLTELLQENAYFIDSIKIDFFGQVLELALAEDRNVNVAALNLLNIIIFYSQSAVDEMVEKNNILDYLQRRLLMEKNLPNNQPHTKQCIHKCTNILCDLLLTRDKNVKKIMFSHNIWQFIYEEMNQASKLFPTVQIFKYFFHAFGRTERNRVLPSFLEAVSHLPLDNETIPEIKCLRETLVNVFYFSMEHNNEEGHEELMALYEQNGLIKYIDEYDKMLERI